MVNTLTASQIPEPLNVILKLQQAARNCIEALAVAPPQAKRCWFSVSQSDPPPTLSILLNDTLECVNLPVRRPKAEMMIIDTIKIHAPTMLRKGSRTADQCKDASLRWSQHLSMPPVRTLVTLSHLVSKVETFRLYLLNSRNEASADVHFSFLREHRRQSTRTIMGT